VGIITNRDLVERGGVSGRIELLRALGAGAREQELAASSAGRLTAAEVMTREVVRVGPDEPLERAAHLMADRRIKRLPVVDQAGRLIGILSRVDVLRTMGEDYHAPAGASAPVTSAAARVVGDVMRREVPSVAAEAPLGEVLDTVTSTRLNRAIVVDSERRVLGVITDADLLARLDPQGQRGLMGALMGRGRVGGESRATARDVMHAPALTVAADTPLAEAAQRMLEGRRKVLPITDAQGRLQGVVDRADLLSAMRQPASEPQREP
jgi:CBS domain-containing protein